MMKAGFFSALYQGSAAMAVVSGRKRKFMNLGIAEAPSFDLMPDDLDDAHHIALYGKMLEMIPQIREKAKNMSALEIGCGRGGGCHVMKHYFHIPDITAVDLSSANIKLAKRFAPGITFVAADALEFKTDKRFDLVVNLESSHRYSSRAGFFKNVSAHLKQNGFFLLGDMIRKTELSAVEQMLQEAGLKLIHTSSVNNSVVRSIEQHSAKQYPLATNFPFLFPRRIHSFFVTIHSRSYHRLKSGEVLYNLYLLQKS